MNPPSLKLQATYTKIYYNILPHPLPSSPYRQHTKNTRFTKTLCSQYYGKTKETCRNVCIWSSGERNGWPVSRHEPLDTTRFMKMCRPGIVSTLIKYRSAVFVYVMQASNLYVYRTQSCSLHVYRIQAYSLHVYRIQAYSLHVYRTQAYSGRQQLAVNRVKMINRQNDTKCKCCVFT